MKSAAVALFLVVLVVTTGCDDRDATTSAKSTATPTSGPKSCGQIEERLGTKVSSLSNPPGPEITCMRSALAAGRSAVVRITYPTVEGDPIHQTYELGTNGRVTLTIDSRADAFAGSGSGIEQVACTKPIWLPGVTCPKPKPKPDESAVWKLDRERSTITGSTTEFVALVSRISCAGGRTGKVPAPDVQIGVHSIVVTFKVPRSTRKQFCPLNAPVPYRVQLPAELRGRLVVDGGCNDPEIGRSQPCRGSRVRIHPPGWREVLGGQS